MHCKNLIKRTVKIWVSLALVFGKYCPDLVLSSYKLSNSTWNSLYFVFTLIYFFVFCISISILSFITNHQLQFFLFATIFHFFKLFFHLSAFLQLSVYVFPTFATLFYFHLCLFNYLFLQSFKRYSCSKSNKLRKEK